MKTKFMRSDTRAVHAGRDELAALSVHAPPIDLSTTYPLGELGSDIDAFDTLARGASCASNPIYARLHNPTVARLAQGLAELEGTDEAVATSSGMAAVRAWPLAPERRPVVATRQLDG